MKPRSETLGEGPAGIRMLEIQLNYHRRDPESDRPAMYRYFVYHYKLKRSSMEDAYGNEVAVESRAFNPFETTGRTVWSCGKGYRRSRKVEEPLEEDFDFWVQKLVPAHCARFGLACLDLD